MQAAPVVIEGVRLRLRRSTPADAADVFRLTADAQVMAHLDFPANRSVADAAAYLQGCTARWEAGSEYHCMIVAKPAAGVLSPPARCARRAPLHHRHAAGPAGRGDTRGHGGNVSPVAEANVLCDPHAADAVFTAPWPVTIVGLDVTHEMLMDDAAFARLRDDGGAERGEAWADLPSRRVCASVRSAQVLELFGRTLRAGTRASSAGSEPA